MAANLSTAQAKAPATAGLEGAAPAAPPACPPPVTVDPFLEALDGHDEISSLSPPLSAYAGGNGEDEGIGLAPLSRAQAAPALQGIRAASSPTSLYPVIWVSQATLELDSRYLVKGLIDQGNFIVIYGPAGSGKSFFTADLAQHIATGQAWRGRKVNQSLAVYVASEAGSSILRRFVGWRESQLGELAEHVPLAILTRGPNLILKQDIAKLSTQLEALREQAKLPLGAVIFDTLSRSMPGGDENKSEDMTEAISVADYLRDSLQAATIFVHHSGKDVERGARGHSSLFAAADGVLCIAERLVTVEKVRDGVAGETFGFDLEPVQLGVDRDGDPVMTCLLLATEGGARLRTRPLSGIGKLAFQALEETLGRKGKDLPGSSTIPRGVRAVEITEWREQFMLRYGTDSSGGEKDKETIRKAFRRAIEQLSQAERIGISDPYVWVRS